MDKLQETIKRIRKEMKWSQEDMAHEIGVSLSTVQRWERQGGNPTRLARKEIKRVLGELEDAEGYRQTKVYKYDTSVSVK